MNKIKHIINNKFLFSKIPNNLLYTLNINVSIHDGLMYMSDFTPCRIDLISIKDRIYNVLKNSFGDKITERYYFGYMYAGAYLPFYNDNKVINKVVNSGSELIELSTYVKYMGL